MLQDSSAALSLNFAFPWGINALQGALRSQVKFRLLQNRWKEQWARQDTGHVANVVQGSILQLVLIWRLPEHACCFYCCLTPLCDGRVYFKWLSARCWLLVVCRLPPPPAPPIFWCCANRSLKCILQCRWQTGSFFSKCVLFSLHFILVLHFEMLACRGTMTALIQFAPLVSRLWRILEVFLSQESIILVTPGCFGTFCDFWILYHVPIMTLKEGGCIGISLLEISSWMWSCWRPKPFQMDKKQHQATYDL